MNWVLVYLTVHKNPFNSPKWEKIVTQAKKIVIESERIQDIVEQQKGFIGGDFKLAIIPTVMPTLLPCF